MAFLILTRAGFDDLLPRLADAGAGAVLHLNAGIASDAELAQLRAAGTALRLLVPPVAVNDHAALERAMAAADGNGGTLWVERALAGPPPPATESADALPRRLARSAGAIARSALRSLRDPGAQRQLMLLPYLGFGNAGALWLKGRVLDEPSFRIQTSADSRWSNLLALVRRL
jgi:hypothetical protein